MPEFATLPRGTSRAEPTLSGSRRPVGSKAGYELVTADDKLVKAVQPTLPFVLPLSSLP